MLTAVIHQPDFMPYLGFFHRLLNADLYIILDTVQFLIRGWHRRDKIKTQNGEKWITVSTRKCPVDTNIKDVLLDPDDKWRQKHLRLFKQNYQKAPFFNEIFPYVQELYEYKCEKMMEFNMHSINIVSLLFDISINKILASTLNIISGRNNELNVAILKEAGANIYLSGIGAREYYDPAPYKTAGIKVIWQNFKHPVYPQQFGEFIPYLSSVDLLFNCGIEESRKILRTC
ncbi:MAG: WbqC family protein [Treponema sp.]|jgi:hypothetical protein|nr:WbqC family protein [Treponema sp.]